MTTNMESSSFTVHTTTGLQKQITGQVNLPVGVVYTLDPSTSLCCICTISIYLYNSVYILGLKWWKWWLQFYPQLRLTLPGLYSGKGVTISVYRFGKQCRHHRIYNFIDARIKIRKIYFPFIISKIFFVCLNEFGAAFPSTFDQYIFLCVSIL